MSGTTRLFVLRRQKGLTQEELARRVGTSQSVISWIESGTWNPTQELLEKICTALELENPQGILDPVVI